MADKKDFEIALKTVATGDGAEKTEESIEKVEAAAKAAALSAASAAGEFKKLGDILRRNAGTADGLAKSVKNTNLLVRETVKEFGKAGGGANAFTSILKGDFSAVGRSITDAISSTKRWGAEVSKVGAGKAAGAIGIFAAGVESMIGLAQNVFRKIIADEKEMFKGQVDGIKQAADALQKGLEAADIAAGRRARLRDSDRTLRLARAAERRDSAIAFDRLATDEALLGTRDPAERARLNREQARRAEDAGYEAELASLDEEQAAGNERMQDAIEKRNRLKAARSKVANMSQELSRLEEDIETPEEAQEMYMNLAAKAGVADFAADNVEKIQSVQDAKEALNTLFTNLGRQIKDADVEIAEAGAADKAYVYKRAQILSRRDTAVSARSVEDQERQRGYDLQNTMRANELKERARQEAEDDAQADLDFAMQRMGHAEKIAALNERRAVRERELADIESELAKLAGIREEKLSEEQKAERARLEARRGTLVGQVRADRNAARDMEWTGDTEAYGRYRQYETELRGEAESDYQMLRQWRERRLGAAGRLGGARNEMGRQQGRLAEAQSQLDYLVQTVKDRNGGEFKYESMSPEERARFNDLRSDVQARRGDVRSATGAYMDALQERAMKDVEFRGSLTESNRLTALGLAGGGELQWGVDTAKNTEEMVRLMKELSDKVGSARTETDSATFGF